MSHYSIRQPASQCKVKQASVRADTLVGEAGHKEQVRLEAALRVPTETPSEAGRSQWLADIYWAPTRVQVLFGT